MDIKELARNFSPLGLDEKETWVLAAVFLSGTRSVAQIAENAGLKRPHTYNILQSLKDRGLVFELIKNKVKHFSPAPAPDLLQFIARKKVELSEAQMKLEPLIPILNAMRQSGTKRPGLRFFWGQEGLLSLYRDTLESKDKVIYGICDFEQVFPREKDPSLNDWMWAYTSDRAQRGILYKGIVNRSATSDQAYKTRAEQRRELKLVSNLDFPLEINIYDDKVAFLSSAINFMGILVEDQAIAGMLRNIHNSLWRFLPDYDLI